MSRLWHIRGVLRTYEYRAADPVTLARTLDVPFADVAARLGVTSDWARRISRDARHADRVRRAVLELALERDRFRAVLQ